MLSTNTFSGKSTDFSQGQVIPRPEINLHPYDDQFPITDKKFDFDYLVYIPRAQGYNYGIRACILEALNRSRRVIILLTSAGEPRTLYNPFTVGERESVIRADLVSLGADQQRVLVWGVCDSLYNDHAWLRDVQASVLASIECTWECAWIPRIGLVGESSNGNGAGFFTSKFPLWGKNPVGVKTFNSPSGTAIREAYFLNDGVFKKDIVPALPKATVNFLENFKRTSEYASLQADAEVVRKIKSNIPSYKYGRIEQTVNAVVVQGGHVLLIQRGSMPGKGKFALPGDYVLQNERFTDALIRILKDTTKLKVPAPVIIGSIKAKREFDDPFRSDRGRFIAQGYLIELRGDAELPKIAARGDADSAVWMPIFLIKRDKMFEDNYHIISSMLGIS